MTDLSPGVRAHQVETANPLRLRLLIEIGRRGSISAAAAACAIGQPSASLHLRTLEAVTGRWLVERHGRGSRLTEAGRVVAEHGERVLALLDQMHRQLEALDGGERGELTIAVNAGPMVSLFPLVLRAFGERHPGITLKVRTGSSEWVARQVATGEADLGVAGQTSPDERLSYETVLVDEIIGIAAPDVLEIEDGVVGVAELGRQTVLIGARGSSTRAVTESYLARVGHKADRVWELDSQEGLKRAVGSRLGVGFVSSLAVADELRRGELVGFHVEGVEPMVRPIQAIHSAGCELQAPEAAFVELLKSQAAQLTTTAAEERVAEELPARKTPKRRVPAEASPVAAETPDLTAALANGRA
ncbi:MAG: LysR substrate-binding domain-containing protein [Solirubrobacteraceae bacterium]